MYVLLWFSCLLIELSSFNNLNKLWLMLIPSGCHATRHKSNFNWGEGSFKDNFHRCLGLRTLCKDNLHPTPVSVFTLQIGCCHRDKWQHLKSENPFFSAGQGVSPKEQLAYLSQVLGFSVTYNDFPKKGEYLSLVSLSTTPPQVRNVAKKCTALDKYLITPCLATAPQQRCL